jgi:hypothetical protein
MMGEHDCDLLLADYRSVRRRQRMGFLIFAAVSEPYGSFADGNDARPAPPELWLSFHLAVNAHSPPRQAEFS